MSEDQGHGSNHAKTGCRSARLGKSIRTPEKAISGHRGPAGLCCDPRSVSAPALRVLSGGREVDPPATDVAELIAGEFGVPLAMLFKASRCTAPVALARQVAMYLTHVMLGRTLTEVGTFYGRDRTTVAHACRLVEDMRDCPDFETRIAALEGRIERGGRTLPAGGEGQLHVAG